MKCAILDGIIYDKVLAMVEGRKDDMKRLIKEEADHVETCQVCKEGVKRLDQQLFEKTGKKVVVR